MKSRYYFIAGALLVLFVGFSGCARKTSELTPQEGTVESVALETNSQTTAAQSAAPSQPIASSPIIEPVRVAVVSATPKQAPVTVASATASAIETPEAASLPQGHMERNKQVQLALKQAGFYTGTVDGKVGPLTQRAVEDFQRTKGLKVDGKVGPVTWGELEKYLSERKNQ